MRHRPDILYVYDVGDVLQEVLVRLPVVTAPISARQPASERTCIMVRFAGQAPQYNST